jgi:hypothetical protein
MAKPVDEIPLVVSESMELIAARISEIAFSIPPPNEYTPQLVALSQTIQRYARNLKRGAKS